MLSISASQHGGRLGWDSWRHIGACRECPDPRIVGIIEKEGNFTGRARHDRTHSTWTRPEFCNGGSWPNQNFENNSGFDVFRGGLPDIIQFDGIEQDVRVDIKSPTICHYIGSSLRFADLAGFSDGIARNDKGISDQLDRPNTYTRRDDRQYSHDPLSVRVARRELGPPSPFIRAVLFIGKICAAGVWLANKLIGWLTKPNDKDNRRKR
jgi:hypothetical protein